MITGLIFTIVTFGGQSQLPAVTGQAPSRPQAKPSAKPTSKTTEKVVVPSRKPAPAKAPTKRNLAQKPVVDSSTANSEALTLALFQDHFVIRKAEDAETVPLVENKPNPALSVMFRRGNAFAVWDERGITVRLKEKAVSSFLEYYPVSPKLFSRADILKNLELFKNGTRQKRASALSGSHRVGQNAYFLVRWEDKTGNPWLEVLTKVDLSGPNPKPELVGRFEGISMARGAIADELQIRSGKLAVVTRKPGEWGLATLDVDKNKFAYRRVGENLESFAQPGKDTFIATERSSYGSTLALTVDIITGERKVLAESTSPLRFVDKQTPLLVFTTNNTDGVLRNLVTGQELTVANGSSVRRTKHGILIWAPMKKPTRAVLVSPNEWVQIASWSN